MPPNRKAAGRFRTSRKIYQLSLGYLLETSLHSICSFTLVDEWVDLRGSVVTVFSEVKDGCWDEFRYSN